MDHHVILHPREGMEFDGAFLRFGDSRAETEALLGLPEDRQPNRSFHLRGELRLDFDGEGKLEFMEFLGGLRGELQPLLYDRSVFQTDAQELLELLLEHNGPDVDDSEAEYSYALRELSVGLYREITPADVRAMVLELTRLDLTSLSQVDLNTDRERANHWETVGMGRPGYYE